MNRTVCIERNTSSPLRGMKLFSVYTLWTMLFFNKVAAVKNWSTSQLKPLLLCCQCGLHSTGIHQYTAWGLHSYVRTILNAHSNGGLEIKIVICCDDVLTLRVDSFSLLQNAWPAQYAHLHGLVTPQPHFNRFLDFGRCCLCSQWVFITVSDTPVIIHKCKMLMKVAF
jgi:hypothetical protein